MQFAYWSWIADFVTVRLESKSCRFKNLSLCLESTCEDYSRAWGWQNQVGTRLDFSHLDDNLHWKLIISHSYKDRLHRHPRLHRHQHLEGSAPSSWWWSSRRPFSNAVYHILDEPFWDNDFRRNYFISQLKRIYCLALFPAAHLYRSYILRCWVMMVVLLEQFHPKPLGWKDCFSKAYELRNLNHQILTLALSCLPRT